MSETIQTRTTQERSGDYRVYASATVGGSQPIKGLAVHTDVTSRIDPNEYVEVEFSNEGPDPFVLEADKATSATIRFATANGPAVRHVYVEPDFLQEFGSFSFDGEDTDLDSVPSLAISGMSPSSESEYESDKEDRESAEEAAEALFGDESESEGQDEENENADDSEEEDDEIEISDEELEIVE